MADRLLERYTSDASGFALLAGVTLDGVPENTALGVSLIGSSLSGILALLVSIFASNLPEALGGAVGMREANRSRGFVIGTWTATGALLAAAVVIGNAAFSGVGGKRCIEQIHQVSVVYLRQTKMDCFAHDEPPPTDYYKGFVEGTRGGEHRKFNGAASSSRWRSSSGRSR